MISVAVPIQDPKHQNKPKKLDYRNIRSLKKIGPLVIHGPCSDAHSEHSLCRHCARESKASAFTSLIIKDILKQCDEDSFNQYASSVDSEEIIEEAHEIDLFPVDLHKQDLKNSEAARVSSREGTLPESCVEHVYFYSSDLDPKLKKCDTTKVPGKNWLVMGRLNEYPLRSKRMKKSK